MLPTSSWYRTLHYRVGPPAFVVLFTVLAQAVVKWGNPNCQAPIFNLGSAFAWKVVLAVYLWAFCSLKIPSKIFEGPKSPSGFTPTYSANGLQFYIASLATFAIIVHLFPWLPLEIYDQFCYIVSALSISALALCIYLLIKGLKETDKDDPNRDFPLPYQFYRGTQLHPRIAGVDVKQFTNCRVGMLGWALLPIVFAMVDAQKNPNGAQGTVSGAAVNALLIAMYVFKFFYWETGYFTTIDITTDRAGYYLCWGSVVWVQAFFSFNSYYPITHPIHCSYLQAAAIVGLGVGAALLEYEVDRQKELFKHSDGKCHIWGKPAKCLAVEYKDGSGNTRKSHLLTSGFWGFARHTNYLFGLVECTSMCLHGACVGILDRGWPCFLYLTFMFVFTVHRVFRDEDKCRAKYGKGYEEYCRIVKYRILPGIF